MIRILEQKKIFYEALSYPFKDKEFVDGLEVARLLNQNPNEVFKTIVTISNSKRYYVFAVPVSKQINLKYAAKEVNEKALELIKTNDLFTVTGYIRGGCSLIGMKKQFPTIVDASALLLERIIFSAGKIGYQVKINPLDLKKAIRVDFKKITD